MARAKRLHKFMRTDREHGILFNCGECRGAWFVRSDMNPKKRELYCIWCGHKSRSKEYDK